MDTNTTDTNNTDINTINTNTDIQGAPTDANIAQEQPVGAGKPVPVGAGLAPAHVWATARGAPAVRTMSPTVIAVAAHIIYTI